MITGALNAEYARHVTAHRSQHGGVPTVTVEVEANVPALGILGSVTHIHVSGHAIAQTP